MTEPEEWEEVRYGAEEKPRTQSGRGRWTGGSNIRYGGGRGSGSQSRTGFRGMNPKLAGVIFDMQGSAAKMTVQFKMNMKRCSKFAGSEFKDDPAGAAAAIRTRSAPSNA